MSNLIWNPQLARYQTNIGTPVDYQTATSGRYGVGGWGAPARSLPPAVHAMSGNGGTNDPSNPFSTVSNVKSASVDSRLGGLFENFDALKAGNQTGLDNYSAAVGAAAPTVKRTTGEDIGAIDGVFNGDLSGILANIRDHRAKALAGVADRARGDASRMLSVNQLAQGGGGRALGTGSYIQKLALDKGADINAKAVMDDAEQQRNDVDYVNRLRLGLTGQRAKLAMTPASQTLLVGDERARQLTQLQQALSQLSQQNLSNTFYGLGKRRGNSGVDTDINGNPLSTFSAGYP